jgi:hypothetical protein
MLPYNELVDLLMVMVGWGDKWLAGEDGPPVLYRHHACGEIRSVDLRCACCGPMHAVDVDPAPRPGGGPTSSRFGTHLRFSTGPAHSHRAG